MSSTSKANNFEHNTDISTKMENCTSSASEVICSEDHVDPEFGLTGKDDDLEDKSRSELSEPDKGFRHDQMNPVETNGTSQSDHGFPVEGEVLETNTEEVIKAGQGNSQDTYYPSMTGAPRRRQQGASHVDSESGETSIKEGTGDEEDAKDKSQVANAKDGTKSEGPGKRGLRAFPA